LPAPVSMKALLEAGVHFGHQTRRWHPRMRPFIFTQRNGIHIIDLQQTVQRLETVADFVRDTVASGKNVLFVGTKRQAQEIIEAEAKRCNMPYVNTRWLGGTLTNFQTIQARIDYLVRMEDAQDRGEFARLSKKDAIKKREEIKRLNRYLAGIKEMTQRPGALYIVDPTRERIAGAEAKRLSVPIVAMVDTNCNPEDIDYPIPANDDAIRAIRLITSYIADAALEGLAVREYAAEAAPEAEVEELLKEGVYSASPEEVEPSEAIHEEAS